MENVCLVEEVCSGVCIYVFKTSVSLLVSIFVNL